VQELIKNVLQHRLTNFLFTLSVLEESIGFKELQATEANSSLEWTIAKYKVKGCKWKKNNTCYSESNLAF